jgi:hypothetical protein
MKFNEIQFPVFRLGTEKPQELDGVVYYHRTLKDGTGGDVIKIVDDRNQEGNTLSLRRLRVLADGGNLKAIHVAIFFLGDLIKLANSRTWFIDNTGKYFIYTKSRSCKLVFKPIDKHLPITGGHIIVVKGVETRFKTLYAPNGAKFAGLLEVGTGYILYGLYDLKPKDTTRRI